MANINGVVCFTNYYRNILNTAGFNEWEDGFNFDNIPKSIRDKAYHIFYSIPTVVEQGTTTLDNQIATTIKIFRRGFRNPKDAIDSAMCDAISLRRLVMNFETLAQYNEVKILGISSVSIVPEPLDNNDNSVIVTLEFITRVIDDLVAPTP